MKSDELSFVHISDVYFDNTENTSPEIWRKFLDEIGVIHISFSRLKVIDHKKYFLAKIKYGI